MADYPVPRNGVAYIFYAGLPSQANTLVFQANPTIASGDFKVSIDGGALANLTTLPTVTPTAGKMVKFSLSAAEMTGDNITVVCSDVAGAEWCDQVFNIATAARGIADLAYPATTGRSIVVDTSGLVDANAVKVGPTGAGTAQTARDLGTSVLLSAGTGAGQLDFTSGVVKANATQLLGGTIPAPNVTGVPLVDLKYTLGTISPATAGSVRADSVTAGVTVTTNNDKTGYTVSTVSDKTGYSLSAGGVQAIWDALTNALTTVGSIGKLIVTNLDALISSRTKPADTQAAVTNLTNAPTAGDFTATMKTSLNAATPNVTVSDKTGFSLNLAQALSVSPTAGTLGQALSAALGDAIGKITYTPPVSNPGTGSIVVYASDGTTVLKTSIVTTDSAGNVLSRV